MNALSFLKQPANWMLKLLDLDGLYSLWRQGPLFEDGWFRSNRERASIDASGEPLPWITYPAIEFIRKRVKPEMSIFEYGSGGSTTWWANLVSHVVSIEHDRQWFERLIAMRRDNIELFQIDCICGGEYSKKIASYQNQFDIVVVDGEDRVNCIRNCLGALTESGIVIVDNSDRSQYAEGIAFLSEHGFRRIEFVGFCPIVNFKSETSIFYRSNNIFGI
jgi:precorrin-6B methylase 2